MDQELLERERELDALSALVDRLVHHGDGGIGVIAGAPGIGKSRLLEAAVDRASGAGAIALLGRGTELEHELSFGVVRELLAPAIRGLDSKGRRSVLRGPAAWAAQLVVPPARPRRPAGDPLFGLAELAANLAERSPLVLAIDDLHWVDASSAAFVAYLARRVAGQRILLLATARDDGLADQRWSDLRANAVIVRPDALSSAAVERLVQAILGGHAPAGLGDDVLRATGGVPFLVEEVARSLADVPEQGRRGVVQHLAPAGVGRAVVERVARLADPATALAEAVALFPAGASLADAASVASIDPEAAASAADDLIGASVLAPGRVLAFLHPVMRAGFYAQLGHFRRRQGHLRAARILMAYGADVEAIAAHLLAAEPVGDAGSVDVLDVAATRAEQVGATHAAIRYLSRALDERPAPDRRMGLAHRLGRLQGVIGAPEAEGTLGQAMAAATDPERIDIAVDLATVRYAAGRYESAVDTLLAVREAASGDRERSLTVDAILATAAWSSERDAELYRAVVDSLPEDLAGSTQGERLALGQIGARLFDRCESHRRVADVLLRVVRHDPVPLAVWDLDLTDPVSILIATGELDVSAEVCRRRQDEARRTGRDSWYVASQVGLARIAHLRGDLSESEAIVDLASELPGASLSDHGTLASQLSGIRALQGRREEAEALLEAAAARGVPSTLLRRQRGRLALASGRVAEAVSIFGEIWQTLERLGSVNPAESTWTALFADALAAAGRRDEALELMSGVLERAERYGEPRPLGLAHLSLGRLHGGERGLGHLDAAVMILAPTPYRLDQANARLEFGAALRRLNRRLDARDHLRRALEYAESYGLAPMAGRAREELAASGARPRRIALTGVGALTPSEARICRLAASGMTNREIATHLFLTVKTVEMHLANAFGKLGIDSRRELAGMLPASDMSGREAADAA